ncbi:glycosyltransferase family 2 protein [Candidatus Roizmanbacteria bacterium]|jgi:glycosyltransferase involved in cell wall biosynthesis|nr:MAG: glycosyltransferase family 2 protein [Candidatus Roizmanbacteria bacterium]
MVPNTTLIILTRNEIEGVKEIVPRIPLDAVDEVIAVDYKSTDGTVAFFEQHKIKVIKQQKKGRGEAFRIAAEQAKNENLLFFSPDGNEDPKDIPKLIGKMDEGFDMVIASRFMKSSHNEEDDQPIKLRKWANQGFTLLANLFWHGKLTDSINGYRIITKKAFDSLKLDGEGFVIEYQMSIRALKLGLRIGEIPTYESSRIAGESGSWAVPTGIQFVIQLFKELFKQ